MKSKLKVGDLIILQDGNTGILLERFDLYNRPNGGDWKSCWCWRLAFSEPMLDYRDKIGWGEVNIVNGCHGKIIRQ